MTETDSPRATPPIADRQAPVERDPPRRHVRRRLRVAARQGEPRHPRLPRGRERLHRQLRPHTSRRCASRSSTRSSCRTQETDLSVPSRSGGYWYYSRTDRGRAVPHCSAGPPSPPTTTGLPRTLQPGVAVPGEQVLVDGNELAEGKDFFSLGAFTVSIDSFLLAYSTDVTGDERYTVHVKDLRTGELLPDEIPNTLHARDLVRRWPDTSSTRRSTTPGGPTRSGGTPSAPRPPTTSSSTTRRTSASGRRPPHHVRPLPDLVDRLQDHVRGAHPRRRRPDGRVPPPRPPRDRRRVRRRPRRRRRRGPAGRPAQQGRPQLHPRHRLDAADVARPARDRHRAQRRRPGQRA